MDGVTYDVSRWHTFQYRKTVDKPLAKIKLTDNPNAKQIVSILLYTSGLQHPLWHPVNLYLHFTKNRPKVKYQVLSKLGLDNFTGTDADLIALIYMINAGYNWDPKLAREIASVDKEDIIFEYYNNSPLPYTADRWVYTLAFIWYVTGFVANVDKDESCEYKDDTLLDFIQERQDKIRTYSPFEIIILAQFYGGHYNPITRKRKLRLIDPYNVVLDRGINYDNISSNSLEDYILEWINNPKDVIYLLGMLPSNVVFEHDYVWDAFIIYDKVANREKKRPIVDLETLEEATDDAIVKFILKKDIEAHISFPRRSDLIRLARTFL